MTIGDVLAALGAILGFCFSGWAIALAFALLFERKAELAADAIASKPWRTGGSGLLVGLIFGAFAVFLFTVPIPGGKLFGTGVALGLMSVSAIGLSGLSVLAARRIQQLDPSISAFTALSRGAALLIIPSILPVFGWFLLGPAVFFVGLGAGVRVLRSTRRTSDQIQGQTELQGQPQSATTYPI